MSSTDFQARPLPEVHEIDGVKYVISTDAAKYLEVDYKTVHNLINRRVPRLETEKIGATLFITLESLEAEKARRDAKKAVQA